MLNKDSSLEDLKSYLFAGTGATLGGVLTPEEVLNFIVAFDEEQQVDSTEKEQCSSLHRYNNRRRKRKVYSKKDPKQSNWYIDYILDERKEYSDPRHRNNKKFTKRFVVDQPGVIEICNTIKNLPEDKQFWTDKCNKSTPLELLVLGVLRILSRNWTFDCISESTNVSQEVHRVFFPKFVKWYRVGKGRSKKKA